MSNYIIDYIGKLVERVCYFLAAYLIVIFVLDEKLWTPESVIVSLMIYAVMHISSIVFGPVMDAAWFAVKIFFRVIIKAAWK